MHFIKLLVKPYVIHIFLFIDIVLSCRCTYSFRVCKNYCMIINSDIQYFQHKTILFIWLRKIYDYGKVSHLK